MTPRIALATLKGCVYLVTCKVNGKQYVGKSINGIRGRKFTHERTAAKSPRLPFHRAIRKYGSSNFDWRVLCRSRNPERLCKLEMQFIRTLSTKVPSGYNLTEGGEGMLGHSHGKDTRRKLSEMNSGRKFTEEHRRRMSEVRRAIFSSAEGKEWRRKNGLAFKGRKHTAESLQKMSESRIGKKMTRDHWEKMMAGRAKALEGKRGVEYRRKLSEGAKRYRASIKGARK